MKKRSILIVDDDDGIRRSIERTLRNEPYKRLYASSVSEAKKLIDENIVHLVISDILMPGFTTKPFGKGTGLGLASVKTMVDSYSGEIDIQSEKNKGTIVNICLPVKSENGYSAKSYKTGGINEPF